jgi:hypothetical protein
MASRKSTGSGKNPQYVVAAALLSAMGGLGSPVHAAGGAYLVDDASITPAGHCQLESWLQALAGGHSLLSVNPACSTGPVEWTAGLVAQSRPSQRQLQPGVKWMLRDPGTQSWGLALQANLSYAHGHTLNRSTYAAATFALDSSKRWALNTEVGGLQVERHAWRPLAGVGIEFELASTVTLLAERLWSARQPTETQAGARWLLGSSSIDLIAGCNTAQRQDKWLTLGINLAF